MRKCILILFSCAFFAQNNAVKVNSVGFFNSGLELSYDRFLRNNTSVEIVFASSKIDSTVDENETNLIGIEGRYKFYLQKNNGLQGVYVAPAASLLYSNHDSYEGLQSNLLFAGAAGLVGYQFMFGKKHQTSGFIFDVNLGFSHYFIDNSQYTNLHKISGFQPRYGISIGYAF